MRRISFVLFILSFSFLSFFSSGGLDSQDGMQYLAVARVMYYTREPLAPVYEYPQKNVHMNLIQRADGKYYSPTGAGYSIVMLPAVFLSDFIHRVYGVSPPEHFPLETDFSVLLFASFTNIFFASMLIVVLYNYAILLEIPHKIAVSFSLLAIVSTNLFPLAKHSFAHMMFICFLVTSFYFLKRFFVKHQYINIFLASASFGIVMISYNPSFILAVPALALYYVLQIRKKFDKEFFYEQLRVFQQASMGGLPFVAFYMWFNTIRTGVGTNSGYGMPAVSNFISSNKILFEGVYGLLLSPGRSFFLYSPILILLILFWHKVEWKKLSNEILSFGVLSVVFIYFFAIQNGGNDWLQWSGESSWGPRYIAVLIPFLMILVMNSWQHIEHRTKLYVGIPIIIISIFVQSMGVLLPYQIKFHDLQSEFKINGTRFSTGDYANFFPRYSPLVNMPRELIKRLKEFPETLNHGKYNVRFIDGVDYPFKLGNSMEWRGLQSQAFITFNTAGNSKIEHISMELFNNPLHPESSHSAIITTFLDNKELKKVAIAANVSQHIEFPVIIDPSKNSHEVHIESLFEATNSARQVIFLKSMKINNENVPLESLDLPYVQPLAQKMTNAQYRYFGKVEKEPWFFWSMHSQVYEGTLDMWWVKALYYWDLPQRILLAILWLNTGIFLFVAHYFITIIYPNSPFLNRSSKSR